MSFFAAGSAIAVAAGATAGGVVATGAGLAASYAGSKLVNKAASGSSSGSTGSAQYNPINVDQLITDARKNAAENYKTSLALESQYNPAQAALRNSATQLATQAALNPPGATPYRGSDVGNSLLNESSQSILDSLRLGASLPADVQAEVTRAALSKGGQAGLAGSFAGRGLVAKDIGTTSLALLKDRQAQALAAGGVLDQLGLNRAQFGLAQDQARNQNAYQFKLLADAFALPESGLSAGDITSLVVGDNNSANQVAQRQAEINQQNANARAAQLNQLLGFGAQAVGGYFGNKQPGVNTLPTTTVGSATVGSAIPGWSPSKY